MVHPAPIRPPAPAEPDPPDDLAGVAAGVQVCRRCDLWRGATQGVPGEGPRQARLMLVGEQPGDREDLTGHPFVGPAGAVLDRALAEAGAVREQCYVTNAVKHFKHEVRGKRRIHSKPDAGEVRACRWWLDNERRLVRPRVIVALGATAAAAVLGRPVAVMKARGPAGALEDGATGFVTIHPSMLLRIPEPAAKAAAYREFVRDLRGAWRLGQD
ncbi:MAG TPA: UdgX family uracil-DNA binding protein [Caulobacteraceae bacterium]|jgi:DNA polymerase|nr:UdgX family uracil-DNA binding protein [Caulobacteraceae bacterium]